MHFVSMHSFGETIVDCRMVQLEVAFHEATKQQLKALAQYLVSNVLQLLEDHFFIEWFLNNRRIAETALCSKIEKSKEFSNLTFRGNVRTSDFNNRRALVQYNTELEHLLNFSLRDTSYSVDYWDEYHRLFSNVQDSEAIKQQLIKLFNMENRYLKQRWFGEDITGGLHAFSYDHRKDLYHGRFDIRIALLCLGPDSVQFSKLMVDVLKGTTNILPEVCGRIALSPIKPPSCCSYHMEYFGGWVRDCPLGRKDYMTEAEWIQSYYLRGAEWVNLLTPGQTNQILGRMKPDSVNLMPLSNGGSLVSVEKEILQTQVTDLCKVKRFLYPILYPGKCEIPIEYLLDPKALGFPVKPRREWENIPVLDREIAVFSDRVVLSYNNYYSI